MPHRETPLNEQNLNRILWLDAAFSIAGPLVALVAIRIPFTLMSVGLRLWVGFLMANLVLWSAVAVGGVFTLLLRRPARRQATSARPLTIGELEEIYAGDGAMIDTEPEPVPAPTPASVNEPAGHAASGATLIVECESLELVGASSDSTFGGEAVD